MDEKEPHWFIVFSRKTNLYVGVTCLLFMFWFLRFGIENMRYVWLSEVFGGEEARIIQAERKMAEALPDLFTANFYELNEKAQLERAEAFWKKELAPIARHMPPEEQAEEKEKIFSAIHRMSNPISNENSAKYDELIRVFKRAHNRDSQIVRTQQ